MPPGYKGQMLRVDLTTGEATAWAPPDALYRDWIGGYGLAPSLSLFSSPFDETVDIKDEVERAKSFAATQVELGLDRTMVSSVAIPARMARPAVGAVLSFTRGGTVAGRATVKADGSYRIRLAAGWYTVEASRRRLAPTKVHVRVTRPTRVDFSLDTGIR